MIYSECVLLLHCNALGAGLPEKEAAASLIRVRVELFGK